TIHPNSKYPASGAPPQLNLFLAQLIQPILLAALVALLRDHFTQLFVKDQGLTFAAVFFELARAFVVPFLDLVGFTFCLALFKTFERFGKGQFLFGFLDRGRLCRGRRRHGFDHRSSLLLRWRLGARRFDALYIQLSLYRSLG